MLLSPFSVFSFLPFCPFSLIPILPFFFWREAWIGMAFFLPFLVLRYRTVPAPPFSSISFPREDFRGKMESSFPGTFVLPGVHKVQVPSLPVPVHKPFSPFFLGRETGRLGLLRWPAILSQEKFALANLFPLSYFLAGSCFRLSFSWRRKLFFFL